MTPQRIQLRRTRGWRLPPDRDVTVVGRPSKWGNPYRLRNQYLVVGPDGFDHVCAPGEARGVAVRLFREDLYDGRLDFTRADVRRELRGHDLACWCPLEDANGNRVPCHADVLLELANS